MRGAGLLLGVGLAAPVAGELAAALRAAGFLVDPVRADTIRLAPPLILTADQADTFVAALPAVLDAHITPDAPPRQDSSAHLSSTVEAT